MPRIHQGLMFSAALSIGLSGQVIAQEQVAQNQTNSTQGEDRLAEVIVTATKRVETTQNVPMSIAAVTTEQIENLGLKTSQDLARVVPGVSIPQTSGGTAFALGGTAPTVAIRGITAAGTAPTTGIYLDDTPLSQRFVLTGGGGQLPQLFDLDRVEVLRGPQGTLYGAGSEGGALRFITPQPNFEKVDGYARAELGLQEVGEANNEIGARVSGPIIQDTLAGLVTIWRRTDGGYIDHVSRFTGDNVGENTNGETHDVIHAALAFKTDHFKATFSYFFFDDNYKDSAGFWGNMPATVAVSGPVNAQNPNGVAYTYGPYNFWGPYKSGDNTNVGDNYYASDAQIQPELQPHWDSTKLPSLTLDWDMGPVDGKLISSYLERYNQTDTNSSWTDIAGNTCTFLRPNTPFNPTNVSMDCGPYTVPFFATVPLYQAPFTIVGTAKGLTEELRFSSNQPDSAFNWVGGLYFNRTKTEGTQTIESALFSSIAAIVNGGGALAPAALAIYEKQLSTDKTSAVFGELTYKIGPLRLTGGVRWERSDFIFNDFQNFPLFGLPPTTNAGEVVEKPVTPKAGVQYVFNEDSNVYFNAGKGYRPGGLNGVVNPTCIPQYQQYGINFAHTYDSDSLWSYEIGSKNRFWDGRATFDASVFYVDWSKVQTQINLPAGACGGVANVAKLISKGGDVQFAILPLTGLTFTLDAAYTDAYYADAVNLGSALFINKGDEQPGNSKFTTNVGLAYAFHVLNVPSYIRTDWQYKSSWLQSFGPGTTSYFPDEYRLPGTRYGTVRLGANVNNVDLSFFVENVTASKDMLSLTALSSAYGRTGCQNAACSVYNTFAVPGLSSTYRPRTFGIDVAYKF